MYCLSKVNKNGNILDNLVTNEWIGFAMASRGRGFKINGEVIKKISVIEKKLARPLVTKKVLSKYNKLIPLLTELVINDDETGDSFREALNHIEKFRLEIKNKYREFLKRKELEMMSKQLSILKKEADKRLMEIRDSYMTMKSSGKGK